VYLRTSVTLLNRWCWTWQW